MPFRRHPLPCIALAAMAVVASAPRARADEGDPAAAVTASDPKVAIEELRLRLLPLPAAAIEAEAAAWMKLLQSKVQQISDAEIDLIHGGEEIRTAHAEAEQESGAAAEVGPVAGAEAEAGQAEAAEAEAKAKAQLLGRLNELRAERTAIIDRVEAVLDALEAKGGDAAAERRYVTAVSGVRIDVRDTGAAWATIVGWLKSPEGGIRWGLNLLKFLAVLLAAWVIALIVGGAADRAMRLNRRLSQLMRQFISRSVRRVVLAVGIIVAISALEINIGPLLAAIGAAGLVIGLALQSTLGNFASGILILFYRPFDVGDFIEAGGVAGQVESLSLVSTTIKTADNKVLILPNNAVWGSVITNVTGSTQRRVDMKFGVAYDADLAETQAVLERVVRSHPLVLAEPEPVVKVHELADSSVNFVCRPWVRTADYWTVYWDVTRGVKEALDEAGIGIPFPQREVHVHHADREPPVPEILPRGQKRPAT